MSANRKCIEMASIVQTIEFTGNILTLSPIHKKFRYLCGIYDPSHTQSMLMPVALKAFAHSWVVVDNQKFQQFQQFSGLSAAQREATH